MKSFSLEFTYALGKPSETATFKLNPEDFIVEEIYDETLSGSGEHFWLRIRKRGENTDWVAKKLANYFSVRKMDVGYGGKKDRHAETTQWFSVYLPGKEHSIDWSTFIAMAQIDAELIEQGSHERKLKLGQHEANRFTIRLRDVHSTQDLENRLQDIKTKGVPNYFGPQRFGREAGNLIKADKWAADPRSIRDRNQRGMIISSARSYLFNLVLSARLNAGNWLSILDGEPEPVATGPLWGRGLSLAKGGALELESGALADFLPWMAALENVGLKQERRALCLKPKDFTYRFEAGALVVSFVLNAGEYATSVLRELVMLNEQEKETRG